MVQPSSSALLLVVSSGAIVRRVSDSVILPVLPYVLIFADFVSVMLAVQRQKRNPV
jgi:hypothetical protein